VDIDGLVHELREFVYSETNIKPSEREILKAA
jgi:hypothetical protein